MPFLLNEEKALKGKLQGLKVQDANAPTGGRPVTVRYRVPEDELGTLTFPLIAITRVNMSPATDREHRGRVALMYTPESEANWNPDVESYDTSPYVVDYPVPMDLQYQITVMSRKEAHLADLTAQLAQPSRLPYRFGFLEVPEDGTVRSLFIDGGPEFEPTRDRDGKRLFQSHYTIRIPTELIPAVIAQAEKAAQVQFSLSVPTS